MDNLRIQELKFLMRTGAAIPVTETRNSEVFQSEFYSDFYTIRELVEQGFMEYIGQQQDVVVLRPKDSFTMYINLELRDLVGGELVTMSLTKDGRSEFEAWLAAQ